MPIRVNNTLIPDDAIEQEVRRMKMFMRDADEDQLRGVVTDQVIERELLRQVAAKRKDKVSAGLVEKRLGEMQTRAGGRKQLLKALGLKTSQLDELRKRIETDIRYERMMIELRDQPEPTDEEITESYRQNAGAFSTQEEVEASHIVLHINEEQDEATARERILKAQAALQAGTPFTEVANTMSDCAGRGGQLGRFPRGQMVQEFEDVVFRMEAGGVSEIFKSPFGLHIATVHARHPSRIRPLDEVRQQVAQQVTDLRRRKAIDAILGDTRETAKIARV